MLRTHAAIFSLLRSVVDIIVIGSCWLIVYFLRFYSGLFAVNQGIPAFRNHLILTLPVICLCYLACLWSGLYQPKRIHNMFKHVTDTLKASLLAALFIFAFLYYIQGSRFSNIGSAPYSRVLLAVFIPVLFAGLSFSHLFTLSILKYLRSRGYNLRHYAVIGTANKAQQLVRDIREMSWLGLKCAFFVDDNAEQQERILLDCPVYGPFGKIPQLIEENDIDEVYLAAGGSEALEVYPMLELLQSSGVIIRIIPDWGNLIAISRPVVVPIGSQVLFSAADSPLSGYNIILKRIFDFTIAAIMLLVLAVPMLLIALVIKLSDKGPVFYKQKRVGMDQKEFEILKFRTMSTDAEQQSGPVWTSHDDARRTKVGMFLRSTSLDELPQLLNVLAGQMSLVGPRPERPYFVKQFSEEYKKYMLRHKVKAGMTGWAQINGMRGDSSLRKRLVYDLYYVGNWSFSLDLWILLRTPWHVIKGVNAY